MHSRIQKWGNSLAVRIPKAFAAQARLQEDSQVEISVDGDTIVVTPLRREWQLDDLVNAITKANSHREHDWGGRVGTETW